MEADWDNRARRNAAYFVATENKQWDTEAFFDTGKKAVHDQVLGDMRNVCGDWLPADMRVLEIGCGIGRLTRSLAEVFGEVHAVDISGEMIERAGEYLAAYRNVQLYRNNGRDLRDLRDEEFHFTFSYLVFQHISSWALLQNYFREVRRVLKPGALFKLQVQGAPARPEVDDTWTGLSLSLGDCRVLAEHSGFDLRHTRGEGTQEFWLWCFKKPWTVR
jgi:cyclopropane fatty-acyl-phospholipid synthase-like methyltransferase